LPPGITNPSSLTGRDARGNVGVVPCKTPPLIAVLPIGDKDT
jgi:hypothetical protein